MADKPKGQPVKLTITSCVVGYQGKNTRGDDYTIYEIQACRESGEAITDKKLRSFENLPTGELLDLLVVPFRSETHGVSYTLSRRTRANTQQRLAKFKEELDALAARLDAVESWIRKRANASQPQAQPQAVAVPVAQASAQDADAMREELDARFGAAPPY